MSEPDTNKSTAASDAVAQAARFREVFERLKSEVHGVFVGHDDLVEQILSVLLSDGHVLLEGVPGLGKTLLTRTLAAALQLSFSRIQFTPDLMPADIVGTMVLREKEGGGHDLAFEAGPLVANFILADEINRATPKTQSALLEAMQERQISVARKTMPLPEPFIVMATQNPIEQEGTYALPEAQLDRFLIKALVDYPSEREYHEILGRTTGLVAPTVEPVSTGDEILAMRRIVRAVEVTEQVRSYAIRIVMATQPGSPHAPAAVNQAVMLGSSPRGAQGLLLLGKVQALRQGRFAVSCEDIRIVALPVLRHRVLLNFEAQADRVNPDELIRAAISSVSELSN
jgi:MoxR-like ATPase